MRFYGSTVPPLERDKWVRSETTCAIADGKSLRTLRLLCALCVQKKFAPQIPKLPDAKKTQRTQRKSSCTNNDAMKLGVCQKK